MMLVLVDTNVLLRVVEFGSRGGILRELEGSQVDEMALTVPR